ncbi:thiamine pyrophosphate-binding protein [Natronolimnohabitans innermongolicus]|uniref:Thiamine pyrophosphate central domain-containing protein n=1 Tax=Natronolimnohabitans innermongolicus JCM 12255 TaxID=1227499 RepID=L9WWI6_9EURY|nr:thiamine pyrophosphate-binding protein [Natronolimnohabitans innermongolicus]ELY53835.1 thiamine pyrophosphate central domain-containing protein [Natronolimnohabitans innermongolicus JCM 12255]
MDVSEAVVDRLAAAGIDTVFGIPGTQTLPLNERLEARAEFRFVMARHETAVSHQAWGYAETSGRPAATVVVPGPGDMNAMNGLKNAYNDCTPVIHLAVETDPERRGGDAIHETPPETYDTVVKSNRLVERPAQTAAVLEEAISVAETPPKGPVRVGIPKSFLSMDVPLVAGGGSERGCAGGGGERNRSRVPAGALERAAELLADADEPVIVAGGGVRAAAASDELRRVACQLGAPVVTTYNGKGVLPDGAGSAAGLVAGTLSGSAAPELLEALATADGALAVGTDLDAVATRGWTVDLPDELVHVTLEADDIATGYEPAVGIVADATDALAALEAALEERGLETVAGPEADSGVETDTARERAAAVRRATSDRLEALRDESPPLTSVGALEAVREGVPADAIVTADAGGFRVWGLNVFDAAGPRSYVNPGSWASMGTGLPSGIGAQCANPSGDVVVLTGDGGLMMCVHELHTAVAEDLPLTVVVFVNDDYAIISDEAERNYGLAADVYGWPDAPIDFEGLAASFGMRTERAETPAAIRSTLESAVEADEPILVAIPTDPNEPQASDWMAE